jgi:hypothetical protein
MTRQARGARFTLDMVADADEPVRRFFAHAISEGAPLARRVRLSMHGRIKAGAWLPFAAEQDNDRRSFEWRARVPGRQLTVLRVTDRYADGAGSMEGRLFGRRRLFGVADQHTTRSAAGRAALEAVTFAPVTLLPDRGVSGRAESDEVIVASWDLPPERPDVRVRLNRDGSVRTVSALRWGPRRDKTYGYIACGCEVHAERRFGDFTIVGRCSVGWDFDTPEYAPFFHAEIDDMVAVA